MQFCPKCGRLMLPKKEGDEVVLECTSCGHRLKNEKLDEYRVVRKVKPEEEKVAMLEGDVSTLPTAKVQCPNCGNDRAYWWMRQTRSADEPTTRFYRCVKCGKVWREYS